MKTQERILLMFITIIVAWSVSATIDGFKTLNSKPVKSTQLALNERIEK